MKKDRSRILHARAETLYSEINAPLLGTTVPFVVTEIIRQGSVMGRSPAYLGIVLNEDLPAGFDRPCPAGKRPEIFLHRETRHGLIARRSHLLFPIRKRSGFIAAGSNTSYLISRVT